MGSCLSKGKKKRNSNDKKHHHVEEEEEGNNKLVLLSSSQAPTSPSLLLSNLSLVSPSKSPVSINSTCSLSSSVSCNSTEFSLPSSLSSTSSSLSSSSSNWSTSALTSKERSFSNEFLRSCAKENPHVLGLHPIRENSFPEKLVYTPKKRVRNSSPVLVRQKSLRRDILERESIYYSSNGPPPSRLLRSPSPSRRFSPESPGRSLRTSSGGGNNRNKIVGLSNANIGENPVPQKPKRVSKKDSSRVNSFLKIKEESTLQIDAIVGKNTVEEMEERKDVESIFMEDITNPHIALDCFIFL